MTRFLLLFAFAILIVGIPFSWVEIRWQIYCYKVRQLNRPKKYKTEQDRRRALGYNN